MRPIVFAGLSKSKQQLFLKGRFLSNESVITKLVLTKFNVDMPSVASQKRIRTLVYCRHLIAALLRDHTDLTLKQIGALLGNRDHSTILSSIKTYNDLIETDPKFRKIAEDLKDGLWKDMNI